LFNNNNYEKLKTRKVLVFCCLLDSIKDLLNFSDFS